MPSAKDRGGVRASDLASTDGPYATTAENTIKAARENARKDAETQRQAGRE